MDAPRDRYFEHVEKLCAISLTRLPRMFDPQTGLAVFRIDGDRQAPAGTSVRYTAISAIGLASADAHGLSSTVDLGKLYAALHKALPTIENPGDLGLILWSAARRDRALAEQAIDKLARFEHLEQHRGGNKVHTTELAWVVTGLAEAFAAGVGDERALRTRLDAAFRRLLWHRGPAGLMCFARTVSGEVSSLGDFLHAELGFFDAQVYAIVAALRFDDVRDSPEAREMARRIGEQILAHQHPLGQWAWHYNARTGKVVDLYPVYSVHQDGMAPMALLQLERALGVLATPAVARGAAWLFGRNELGELMAIPERALVRRSIRRRSPMRRVVVPLKAASLMRLGQTTNLGACLSDPSILEVDTEMRPYHLGWCLYAFSEIVAAARRARRAAAAPPAVVEPSHASAQNTKGRASNLV